MKFRWAKFVMGLADRICLNFFKIDGASRFSIAILIVKLDGSANGNLLLLLDDNRNSNFHSPKANQFTARNSPFTVHNSEF